MSKRRGCNSRLAASLVDRGRPLWVFARKPVLEALRICLLAGACFREDAVGLQAVDGFLEAGNLLVGAVDGLHVGGKGSLGWGVVSVGCGRPDRDHLRDACLAMSGSNMRGSAERSCRNCIGGVSQAGNHNALGAGQTCLDMHLVEAVEHVLELLLLLGPALDHWRLLVGVVGVVGHGGRRRVVLQERDRDTGFPRLYAAGSAEITPSRAGGRMAADLDAMNLNCDALARVPATNEKKRRVCCLLGKRLYDWPPAECCRAPNQIGHCRTVWGGVTRRLERAPQRCRCCSAAGRSLGQQRAGFSVGAAAPDAANNRRKATKVPLFPPSLAASNNNPNPTNPGERRQVQVCTGRVSGKPGLFALLFLCAT